MRRAVFRSTIFNIAFMAATLVMCIAYIPLLILPRRVFTAAVAFWIYVVTSLEYSILDLKYEVRGREYLPKDGPFLIAAKHQSAYETFKLRILLKDPAIVLKKELLLIPLWGWYLRKSDVIAIDRSTPEKALKSLESGALRMKEQGRPIVIFPQGTRVKPEETVSQKPYKAGIARIQEITQLPIIPLALNTGLFWPRSGWLKSSGKVIFEFMKPIPPGGNRRDLMKELEQKIEDSSRSLMNEAREKELDSPASPAKWIGLAVVAALLFGIYTVAWFETAERVKEGYVKVLNDAAGVQNPQIPIASGFPGPIHLHVAQEIIHSDKGSVRVEKLDAWGWPIPFVPIKIHTGPVTVNSFKWSQPLVIDSTKSRITYWNDVITILDNEIMQGEFLGSVHGTVDLKQEPVPKFELDVILKNHNALLLTLAQNGIIDGRMALFMGAGFGALADTDGNVQVPITQRGQILYAGPLPVASLPALPRQEPGNQPAPDL